MEQYKTVLEGGTGEIIEKKSRFIATVRPVRNEEEALAFLEEMRKQYWDARHNCMAYVIDGIQRFSDDGEPSGTAGKPILEVLTGRKIHDCIIIVTRYFGGTLLGTGGLVRAYQKASLDAIDNSTLARRTKGSRITITTDYSGAGKIQYTAAQNGWTVEDIIYAADVSLIIAVPEDMTERVIKEATDITSGKAQISEEKNIDIEEEL